MNESKLYFSTFTNLNWLPVLEKDKHKEIIIKSLQFLVKEKRVRLYCFVIMPNHIHLIWLINNGHLLKNVQRDFLKYTAQQIRFRLIDSNNQFLDKLIVNSKDRKTQVWERNGLSFQLFKKATILQKFEYIHGNPLKEKWKLAQRPEDYFYSSAMFYETEKDTFNMLTHISETL